MAVEPIPYVKTEEHSECEKEEFRYHNYITELNTKNCNYLTKLPERTKNLQSVIKAQMANVCNRFVIWYKPKIRSAYYLGSDILCTRYRESIIRKEH